MSEDKKTSAPGNGNQPSEDSDAELAAAEQEQREAAPNGARDKGGVKDEAAEEVPPEVEISKLKDRLLRSMAETENLRARADRERQETRKYAVSAFARDMLAVADGLRRALDNLPGELSGDDSIKTVIAGIEMTQRELMQMFEKHDIRPIEPMGEKFDHNFHQAMFEAEGGDQVPGTIIKVVQIGFTIHGRLLRPAMVGVAKGPKGPKGEKGEKVDTVV